MRLYSLAALGLLACGRPAHTLDAAVDDDAPLDSAFEDTDGDGIPDAVEGRWPSPPRDTDGDGTPDYKDDDSDADGLTDVVEGVGDDDGDGVPNYIDPRNDGPPPTWTFVAISTPFNSPIGIDFHSPTSSVVVSVNYSTAGLPQNFDRILLDGSHAPFSTYAGLTDEVKIATARPDNPGGWEPGTLFTGNGIDGQIVKISADGSQIANPWVDLPGDNNGLMRGSLYVDRTGMFDGDLIVVTSLGQIWRVTPAGVPTQVATPTGVHLEGMVVVPYVPARYGPLAGKIIVGAENERLLWAIAPDGTTATYDVGVAIEDIDMVTPHENFFGVNFGTSRLLGVTAAEVAPMTGDILLTTETVTPGTSGLFRLQWDGTQLVALPIALGAASAPVAQWEHVTFANAGIGEIQ